MFNEEKILKMKKSFYGKIFEKKVQNGKNVQQ